VATTPNCQIIKLPKSEKNIWNWQGITVQGVEHFIEIIRCKLLAFGLSDYTLTSLEPTDTQAARLKYSFPDRLSCLQFQAMVLPNKERIFTQHIPCNTKTEADFRKHNIERFMKIHGIKGSVIWLEEEKKLSVLTNFRYDDLAIAIHHEMGRFDEKDYKPDPNRVVTRMYLFHNNPK
jgi:hypothetical protein